LRREFAEKAVVGPALFGVHPLLSHDLNREIPCIFPQSREISPKFPAEKGSLETASSANQSPSLGILCLNRRNSRRLGPQNPAH
jgi:hypothetical protein